MGRDLKMINDNHAKLIQKFPDYVSYNGHKEMMGGTFNKIKIQYNESISIVTNKFFRGIYVLTIGILFDIIQDNIKGKYDDCRF